MAEHDDDELFVVKKWHLYVVVTAVLSFMAGMTIRSLLLGPMPYAVVSSAPTDAPASSSPTASSVAAQPSATPRAIEVSPDDDPGIGPADAPVLIVGFSDFQCSHCARFGRDTLGQILDTYGNQVRFVFRDFPLMSLHPQALKAAEAAQCVHDQGRFWEYHDLLFRNQEAVDVESLKDYARQLGLDVAAFTSCLDTDRHFSEVQHDLTEGQSYGVTGTPTFFINGRLLVGAKPFADFQAIIEEELGH